MHQIEKSIAYVFPNEEVVNVSLEHPEQKVIIIDRMAIVNQRKKTADIKMCKSLAKVFSQ